MVTAIDTAVRGLVGIGETSMGVLLLPGVSLVAAFLIAYRLNNLDLLNWE